MSKKALVRRAGQNKKGRFTKGNTLSKGRKKGSKNRATLVKEQMAEKSTLMLGRMAPHLMKKAMEMAMEGDTGIMKDLLARIYPKTEQTEDGDKMVEVIINNFTVPDKPELVKAEVIEGEFDELGNEQRELRADDEASSGQVQVRLTETVGARLEGAEGDS